MFVKIQRDQSRFKQIVRGKVRENLRKYVTHGEMIGRKGRDLVSIPLPQLDVPHFRYGKNGSGGVGQGEGEEGKPIGQGEQRGRAARPAAIRVPTSSKSKSRWTNWPRSWVTSWPCRGSSRRASRTSIRTRPRYTSVRRSGPESLRHFKRTYMQALRRQISSNIYVPHEPRIVPIREDKRYRSWTDILEPQANAVIIYMMDVSGSMTDDQKEIVRTAAFWLDTWLKSQYEGVETRYIIHDAAAKEVDEETFYHTRESGGTRISSAYRVCANLIANQFPSSDWNIYCFQFSDGDNWGEDNEKSLQLLRETLLPEVNLFCYGQVESPYGSGEFLRSLNSSFGETAENLVLSEIENKEAIYDMLKQFLGKGK